MIPETNAQNAIHSHVTQFPPFPVSSTHRLKSIRAYIIYRIERRVQKTPKEVLEIGSENVDYCKGSIRTLATKTSEEPTFNYFRCYATLKKIPTPTGMLTRLDESETSFPENVAGASHSKLKHENGMQQFGWTASVSFDVSFLGMSRHKKNGHQSIRRNEANNLS
uniref:Uncharacterized protein n=1 Tax=Glossina pallidipes TaxID=7398 RepID=A0A1A9ZAL2_GLOPL